MFGFFQRKSAPSQRPAAVLRFEPLECRVTPATITIQPAYYSVELGKTLSIPANTSSTAPVNLHGLLYNTQGLVDPGQLLTVTSVGQPIYGSASGGQLTQVPPGSSVQSAPGQGLNSPSVNPDGSFTFVAPSVVPTGAVDVEFAFSVLSSSGDTGLGVAIIKLIQPGSTLVAAAADAGAGPDVKVFQTGTGVVKYDFFPYESTFTGGVQVAVGDLNNDGYPDIATIPSVGGGPRLEIFDGKTGQKLIDQFVFDPGFRGGGSVAIGDFLGNGLNQIAVGAGVGGGPRVTIFELLGRSINKRPIPPLCSPQPSPTMG